MRHGISQWAPENQHGTHGEHQYRAADFGLVDDEIRQRVFAEYLDRFGRYCFPEV